MGRILSVKNFKCYFPVKSGLFQRVSGYLKAVDGVDLHVNHGEIVSVVGESGCGKSTLGNSIVGLNLPTSGELVFNEKKIDITNYKSWNSDIREDIQIIFQDPYSSLNPRQTVHEIISEPMLRFKKSSPNKVRGEVEKLLEKVGLSREYIDRFPHAFSGGQRQRLAIARALAIKPKLIICDEIVSALDVSVQAQIIRLLMDLKKEYQLSLLFIAHDLSLVKAISDRVYVMYLGKITETNLNSVLFKNPRHPYTQSLLDSIPTLDKTKKPVPIEGEVPSLSNLPIGCSFYARCKNKLDKCEFNQPKLEIEESKGFSCFNPL